VNMEISPNRGNGPVSRIWNQASPSAPGAPRADSVRFDGAAALNRALADTPDRRADQVERARQLLGEASYPPAETIRRIASLLATKLDNEAAEV